MIVRAAITGGAAAAIRTIIFPVAPRRSQLAIDRDQYVQGSIIGYTFPADRSRQFSQFWLAVVEAPRGCLDKCFVETDHALVVFDARLVE